MGLQWFFSFLFGPRFISSSTRLIGFIFYPLFSQLHFSSPLAFGIRGFYFSIGLADLEGKSPDNHALISHVGFIKTAC